MKSGSIWNPSRVPTSQIVHALGSFMVTLLSAGRDVPAGVWRLGSPPNLVAHPPNVKVLPTELTTISAGK